MGKCDKVCNYIIFYRGWDRVVKKGFMWCCSGIQTRVLVGSQALYFRNRSEICVKRAPVSPVCA